MSRIFISYKRKNKKQVVGIVNQIEGALNEKCFMDYNEIETNAYFLDIICKAIDDSEVVLFMHSSLHNKIDYDNDWTMKEYRYAKEKGKNVVLVKLDNSKLDNVFLFEFGSRNYVDSHDQDQVDRLIKDLAKWLKIKVARKTDQPAPKPEPIQKKQPEQEPEVKPNKESTQTSRQDSHPHVSYRWLFVASACVIIAVVLYPFIHRTNQTVSSSIIEFIEDSTLNKDTIVAAPVEPEARTEPVQIEEKPQPTPSKPVQKEVKKTDVVLSEATGVIGGHDYVDLGLSVLWATCNLGASKPSESGQFYAWAEVESKSDYSWPSYKLLLNGTNKDNAVLSKYVLDSKSGNVDDLHILESMDDAATVVWNNRWRMPSKDEFDELVNECSWKWVNVNGINGYLITSNVIGYEKNNIFLPAAGYCQRTNIQKRGERGCYWSSTIGTYSHSAQYLGFNSSMSRTYNEERYIGRTVRPVHNKE